MALALAALLTLGLAYVGSPGWVAIAVAAVPWVLCGRERLGTVLAVVGVGTGAALGLLVLAWLGPALGFDAVAAAVWLAAGMGVVGAWRLQQVGALRRPAVAGLAMWGGACVGGLAWPAVMLAAQFYPGAASVAWAMTGDSANNVIFAREVLDRGGLQFGARSNPVPLPSVAAALGMWGGRAQVDASDLTRHDVTAFATTWSLFIVATCIGIGLVVGVAARRWTGAPGVIAAASLGGSLLGMSWFIGGYPIDYGFFNAHVTFVLLAAALAVALEGRTRPVAAVCVLLGLSSATLAVWSPLAAIPVALAAAVVLATPRTFLALRGMRLWALLASIGQLALYVVLVTIPAYLAQQEALAGPGGAFAFRHKMMPGLAVLAIVLAIGTSWRKGRADLLLALGVGGSASAVLAFLLAQSANAANRWTYYPLKLSWFASVALLVLIAALAVGNVLRHLRHPLLVWPGLVAVTAASLGIAWWAPTSGNGYSAEVPAKRVLAGTVFGDGDVWAERVFDLASLDDAHLLWHTSDPVSEGSINFWILQIRSNSMSENLELKYFAYGMYDHDDISALCDIVAEIDAPVTVHTAEADLAERLAGACGDLETRVVVE